MRRRQRRAAHPPTPEDQDRGRVIYIALETLGNPRGVDIFFRVRSEGDLNRAQSIVAQEMINKDTLIIIDSLNAVAELVGDSLASYLSSLFAPRTSLVGIYHADVPAGVASTCYAPSPLTLLRYLATTILTTHSLSHEIARKSARDRSLADPTFGMAENIEGVLAGLGSNNNDHGVVVAMESRRKSGRSVRETFVLLSSSSRRSRAIRTTPEGFIRLRDYSPFRASERSVVEHDPSGPPDDDLGTTFDLGLNLKQRRDRENVVLPYFDAQQTEGGVGGRILYQMGAEDDFDDEEDEI
ncbi:MAG: SNAP receptor [Watsoniomyces obsoletus]|nr:MAG: SNAP receptor [Watsoniomyces obsoletus]